MHQFPCVVIIIKFILLSLKINYFLHQFIVIRDLITFMLHQGINISHVFHYYIKFCKQLHHSYKNKIAKCRKKYSQSIKYFSYNQINFHVFNIYIISLSILSFINIIKLYTLKLFSKVSASQRLQESYFPSISCFPSLVMSFCCRFHICQAFSLNYIYFLIAGKVSRKTSFQ